MPVRSGSSRQSLRRAYGALQKRQRFESGPFVGMRDSVDPTAGRDGLAKMLRNVYPQQPEFGGAVVHRPGYTSLDDLAGSIQLIYQFTKLDGTEMTLVVAGGSVYQYDWAAGACVLVLAPSPFGLPATYSDVSRWHAVTFNDQVIFSDGHTRPFAWDGTQLGGCTDLSNCPVLYGPMTVHYGKLFGIKAAERSTLVWSEENQPNVGYEAGGYNNAWTLLQTDSNPLERLLGSNEALFVWRARSITAISGEVTENFASTGTREAVSSGIGTTAPDSVFFGGDDGEMIFFADADGRPHYMLQGGSPVPIWEDARNTLARFDPARLDEVEGYWDPLTGHAVFCYALLGETKRSDMLRYHTFTKPQLACIWNGYDIARIGVVENEAGQPRIFHGNTATDTLFGHDAPDGPVVDDDLTTTTEDYNAPIADNSEALTAGANTAYSQSFTATTDGRLYSASWQLYRNAGVLGYAVAKLYAISGVHGTSAVPTGEALATSAIASVSDLSESSYGSFLEFVFPDRYLLTAGENYALVIELISATGGNVFVSEVAFGIHAGNGAAYDSVTEVWTPQTTHDFAFYVKTAVGVVEREVETHPEPYTEFVELNFDRLDVQVRSREAVTPMYAQTLTPNGVSEPAQVGFEDGISLWDDAVWDESVWDYGATIRHGVLGIDAFGTCCGVKLTHSSPGAAFSLLTLSLQGRVIGADVSAR